MFICLSMNFVHMSAINSFAQVSDSLEFFGLCFSDHTRFDHALELCGHPLSGFGKDFLLIIAGDDNTQCWRQEITHREDAP